MYLTNEELAFRNNEEQWYKYELDNVNVAGLENVNWGSFGSAIDIRSIPDMKDILKDSVQFFMGSFYKRFTFGENEIIETLDNSYECKQINLTFTNKEFYPILQDFLRFNDNSIGIRTGIKDRIQRFLNVVDENDLYGSITSRLYGCKPDGYGSEREYRLAQEIVLGIGGIRMLEALGFTNIKKYHMNEGHSALMVLELLNNNKNKEEEPSTATGEHYEARTEKEKTLKKGEKLFPWRGFNV